MKTLERMKTLAYYQNFVSAETIERAAIALEMEAGDLSTIEVARVMRVTKSTAQVALLRLMEQGRVARVRSRRHAQGVGASAFRYHLLHEESRA